jgi:hypothetical protein
MINAMHWKLLFGRRFTDKSVPALESLVESSAAPWWAMTSGVRQQKFLKHILMLYVSVMS